MIDLSHPLGYLGIWEFLETLELKRDRPSHLGLKYK
jgi:hypothetical protein